MTEELARTKWCPMVRSLAGAVHVQAIGTANTFNEAFESPNCIASDCMMWREVKDYVRNSPNDSVPGYEVIGGYCGLAGKL